MNRENLALLMLLLTAVLAVFLVFQKETIIYTFEGETAVPPANWDVSYSQPIDVVVKISACYFVQYESCDQDFLEENLTLARDFSFRSIPTQARIIWPQAMDVQVNVPRYDFGLILLGFLIAEGAIIGLYFLDKYLRSIRRNKENA